MFLVVFWEHLFQIPISLLRYHLSSIIFSNKIIRKFAAFSIGDFIIVVYIKNTIYCITSIWNFRSINNFSIFYPGIIISCFERMAIFLSTIFLMKLCNFLHSMTASSYFCFSMLLLWGIYFCFLFKYMSLPTLKSTIYFFLLIINS